MKFEPIFLPPDRALDGRVSQTFLAKFNVCRRGAYLYRLHDGGAASHEMARGSAVHEIARRATLAAIEQGEPLIPGDVVKVIADEVLAEMDVPFEQHDYVRECSWRLASWLTIDPQAVIACESLFVLEIGGWQVRGRVDFAELLDGGAAARIVDYKSSRALPTYEDVARTRPDGTLAAKSFQLVLYALLVAFGRPVRVEGDREFVEPFSLAGPAQRFDLAYAYPGIEDREGNMALRPVSLTRLEIEEYRASLAGMLDRVAEAEREGDWPAVPGSHCSECAAPGECPLPAVLRDYAGTINTVEQAREAAEKMDREAALLAARREELKRFAKSRGIEIRYGRDKAWRFVYGESERIADKDRMWDAVERAVRYGEPFDRSQHVKTSNSTTFKAVTLSETELAEEMVGHGD